MGYCKGLNGEGGRAGSNNGSAWGGRGGGGEGRVSGRITNANEIPCNTREEIAHARQAGAGRGQSTAEAGRKPQVKEGKMRAAAEKKQMKQEIGTRACLLTANRLARSNARLVLQGACLWLPPPIRLSASCRCVSRSRRVSKKNILILKN